MIRFRRTWRTYKAGQETDAIPDGVANTLIRIGAAALVEEVKNEPTPVEEHNADEPTDSSDGADSGTSDTGGSEETTVSGGVGHTKRRRTGKQDPSGSGTVGT